MDRARRSSTTATNRRISLAASSSSPLSNSGGSSDHPLPTSPVPAHAGRSPQSAPQSRRVSKSFNHSLSFPAPEPPRPGHSTRRSKTMDDYGHDDGGGENGSPQKGGHTLRRRARVDYTFEHIDDEPVVPNSTSSVRGKKRRSDNSTEPTEEFPTMGPARRRASLDGDTPSSRRRNPTRKTSEIKSYIEDDEDDEDEDLRQDLVVQDSIQVHPPFSDDDELSLMSRSRNSDPGPMGGATSPTEPQEDMSASIYMNESIVSDDAIDPDLLIDPALMGDLDNADDSPADPAQQLQVEAAEVKAEKTVSQPSNELQEQSDTSKLPKTPSPEVSEANGLGSPAAEADVTMASPEQVKEESETKTLLPVSENENIPKTSSNPEEPLAEEVASADTEMNDAPALPTPAEEEDELSLTKESSKLTTPELDNSDEKIPVASTEPQDAKDSMAVPAVIVTDPSNHTAVGTAPDAQSSLAAKQPIKSSPLAPSPVLRYRKPQPTPVGKWAHLTPYIEGEFVTYPEKKEATPEGETAGDDTAQEEKESDKDADKEQEKDSNDIEPMVEDNEDAPEPSAPEAPTPALNTPTRGSPAPESMEPTASNSPAPGIDFGEDGDDSEAQDDSESKTYFRYRKLRDADEFISAIENYEDMSTTELYELLEAINVSLVQWQTEWSGLGKVVDDYENSLRRRLADTKYESRTRNLNQHGINYEEPEFVVKGYKAKEREVMSETRYLQGQDRIMAAAYGFEYDPHPSKIGRQNPETQQVGIMTRGRSLRNQPRQTAKATEGDEVTGKRQRKPVQLFDPAPQDISRSSTPVPGRTRRRRNAPDDDNTTASFNGDAASEADEPPSRTRRRRGNARPKTSAPDSVEDFGSQEAPEPEDTGRSGRRGRARAQARYDNSIDQDDEDSREHKPPRRHLLTLKIPRGKNFSEPSSAITDNGDSRPSTASSESSSHTAESSYSFRPKRQKRFRDELEESEGGGQGPPKKRGKRTPDDNSVEENAPDSSQNSTGKRSKIRVVNRGGESNSRGAWKMIIHAPTRDRTPSSVGGTEGDEPKKDYKLMTKSEKMSASMKSKLTNSLIIYICI